MGSLDITRVRTVSTVSLADTPIRIGRSSTNDIVLSSTRVSRKHCIIERVAERLRVRDLGSRLGTRVNGREIEDPQELHDGDILEIASFRLLVRDDQHPAPTSNLEARAADLADREAELARRAAEATRHETTIAERQTALDSARQELEDQRRDLERARADIIPAAAVEAPGAAEDRGAMDAERVALDERLRDIETRAGDLAEREEDLDARERAHAERAAGDDERIADLDAREAALEARERAHAERTAGDDERIADLDAREAALEARERAHAERTAGDVERIADLDAREAALEDAKGALAERVTDVEGRETALREAAAARAGEDSALQSREDALEKRNAVLAERAAQLDERDAAADVRNRELLEREQAIEAARTKSVDAGSAALAHAEATIEQLRAELAERQHAWATERDELQAAALQTAPKLEDRIATLRNTCAALCRASDALSDQQARLRNVESLWLDLDERVEEGEESGAVSPSDLMQRERLARDLEEAAEARDLAVEDLQTLVENIERTVQSDSSEPPIPIVTVRTRSSAEPPSKKPAKKKLRLPWRGRG